MPQLEIDVQKADSDIRKIISSFVELRNKAVDAYDGSTQGAKQLITTLSHIERAQKDLIEAIKQKEKKLRDEGKIIDSSSEKYNKYSASMRNAAKGQRAFNANLQQTQQQLKNTTSQLQLAQKQLQTFQSTGKGTSIGGIFAGVSKGLKDILSAFGVIAGVQLFASAIQSAFDLTRQLDSLSFAMKAVITDVEELGQTEAWIQNITKNYGAEIVTTTNRYIKFRAAAKAAGLTAQETQKIFETMTKVSGVLGLRTDELQGIYLALEQMISKGKITTEELRRQLGERLPGAMDIMATSMGITTAQLDEMLKKGEVITKDVLPAFAEEVNKAFGLDSVTKVSTLQAATIRLKNAWTNLVADFNKARGVSRDLMNGLDFIANNLGTIIGVISGATVVFLAYKASIVATNIATTIYSTTLKLFNGTLLLNIAQMQRATLAAVQNTLATITWKNATLVASQALAVMNRQLLIMKTAFLNNPITGFITVIGIAITAIIGFNKLLKENLEEQTKIRKEQLELSKQTRETALSVELLKDRYDELKSQTKLNKEESKELADVIKQIGEFAKTAVTSVDEFGRAIDINSDKVQDFINKTLEITNLEAKIAITEEGFSLDKVKEDLVEFDKLAAGQEARITGVGQRVRRVTKETAEGTKTVFEVFSKGSSKWAGGFKELSDGMLLKLLQTEQSLKKQKDESEKLINNFQKLANRKAQDITRESIIAKEKAFIASIEEKTAENIRKQTAQYHSDRMKEIKDEMLVQSTSQTTELKYLKDKGRLETTSEANIRKNGELLLVHNEHEKRYNELMHISNKTTNGKIKQLKEIVDLMNEINRLNNEIKELELQIEFDSDLTGFERKLEIAKEIYKLQTKQSESKRDQDVEVAQTEFDNLSAPIDKEIEAGASGERLEELLNNKLQIQQQFDQKFEKAALEHTKNLIKINDILTKTNISIIEERNEHELAMLEDKYQKELIIIRSGEIAKINDIRKKEEDARKLFEEEGGGLKAQMKLQETLKGLKYEEEEVRRNAANEILKIEADKTNALIDLGIQQLEIQMDIESALGASAERMKELEAAINKLKSMKVETPEFKVPDDEAWQVTLSKMIDQTMEFAKAIEDIFKSISDAKIENIEAEIRASEERFDREIELEEGNKLQQDLLTKAKEVETKRLEKEKLKAQQKAAKLGKAFAVADIQMKLAQTLMAINLTAPPLDAIVPGGFLGRIYQAIQVPLAIGLAAAQTAAVLAAPIPKYAEGSKGEIKEAHLGMINDAGRQEYIERDGEILTTKKKNAIIPLEAGDTVYKSYDDLTKKSMMMAGLYNGVKINVNEFDGMFFGIESAITKGFKKAKVGVNVNLRGSDPNFEYYKYKMSNWS